MDKVALEAALNNLDIWLIVFGVLVAIGVVGESIFGFLHWRRSGQLQALQTVENLALQKGISEANARALEAQVSLEKYRAPRSLSAEQQAVFIETLRPFSGQEYALSVATTGQEPAALVCLLNKLLMDAGWQRRTMPSSTGLSSSVNTDCGPVEANAASDVHVRVAVNAPSETSASADALISALVAADIPTHPGRDPKNIPIRTVILLMVGVKQR